MASLLRTSNPLSEKNRDAPIGDTAIGLQGKKYLALSQGEKKATPKPPLVNASKTGCEAVQVKKNSTRLKNDLHEKYWSEKKEALNVPKTIANNKE